MLFVYYPQRVFIEEAENSKAKNEIAVTMLNPELKVPLIRYKTGDLGRIIPYKRLKEVLARFAYSKFIPELKLPLIAIYGRNQAIEFEGKLVYAEEIKEALYSDFNFASSVTGAFKLTKSQEGILLSVQLKKNMELSQPLQDNFKAALKHFCQAPLNIAYYSYQNFPYFMELDYERKFNYI